MYWVSVRLLSQLRFVRLPRSVLTARGVRLCVDSFPQSWLILRVWGCASAAGPLFGGLLTEKATW